jgi:hypothetical protein
MLGKINGVVSTARAMQCRMKLENGLSVVLKERDGTVVGREPAATLGLAPRSSTCAHDRLGMQTA